MNRIESHWFTSQTQDQFRPLARQERTKVFVKDFINPYFYVVAGAAAGINQWFDFPEGWPQGAGGYGRRVGDYLARRSIQQTLVWGGEIALHEDNRYFRSGRSGVWARLKYAAASSVLARHDSGKRSISLSQLGGTAGAAFLSRAWQPPGNRSAGDGAASFGFALAGSAGWNVFLEFLPDLLGKKQ